MGWSLANKRAAKWAKKNAGETYSDLSTKQKQVIKRAISNSFLKGQTRGELEEELSKYMDSERAEIIAVTETTRAAARAEDAIWDELAADGIEMDTSWNTCNDELVCEICKPLHGTLADGRDAEGPYWILESDEGTITVHCPAHLGCRCNENNVLPGL